MNNCDKIGVDILEIYLTPKKLGMDERVKKMANIIQTILCEFCDESKKENCLYGDPELMMICFYKIKKWLESEVTEND